MTVAESRYKTTKRFLHEGFHKEETALANFKVVLLWKEECPGGLVVADKSPKR